MCLSCPSLSPHLPSTKVEQNQNLRRYSFSWVLGIDCSLIARQCCPWPAGVGWRLVVLRLRKFPRDVAVRRAAEEETQLFPGVLSDVMTMSTPDKRDEASPGWQDVGVHLPLHHAQHHTHVLHSDSHIHDPEDARVLQTVLARVALPERWPVLAKHTTRGRRLLVCV